MSKENKMIVGAVVVGLIVGFGAGFMLWGTERGGSLVVNKIESEKITDDADTQSTQAVGSAMQQVGKPQAAAVALGVEQNIASHDNMLEVMKQKAGNTTIVSKAKLGSPVSWIAVHEDINGDLGNVLGARAFGAGEYANITVPLLRGTVAGKTYHVGIYVDNGDKKFDRKTDMMLRAQDGEMIGSTFTTE